MKKVEIIYGSIIEQIKILAGGNKAKAAEAIGMFALYDYEGEEYDGDNTLVKMAFAGAKPMNDLHEVRALAGAKGGAKSHGGGAPKGNQNGRKIQQANSTSKILRGDNTPLEIQQANNKQTFEQGCNSLINSELQSPKFNKQNSTSKTSKPSMIREDIESLDNTSPLTELVLSKQKEKKLKKEKDEPALATGMGGAAPSFSERQPEKIGNGKDALATGMGGSSLPINRNEKNWNGTPAIPQTSSDIRKPLQGPHTPSPRSPEYKCAERFLRGIEGHDVLYDNSKEAEIERERERRAKLIQLREMETDPLQRSAITEIINSIRIVS